MRKMSPETAAPRPPPPPLKVVLLPPIAPRASSAYSPVDGAIKLNFPGVVRGSAFASAQQANIAKAETPASNIALDLIMRFPFVACRDCPASLAKGISEWRDCDCQITIPCAAASNPPQPAVGSPLELGRLGQRY